MKKITLITLSIAALTLAGCAKNGERLFTVRGKVCYTLPDGQQVCAVGDGKNPVAIEGTLNFGEKPR